MFTADEIADLRALAESRMTDTCRITKPGTGPRDMDPDTMQYADPEPVIVYEGICRIPRRGPSAVSASKTSGGDASSWQVGEYPLGIPIDGDGYTGQGEVAVDMTVEYLTCVNDPTLVGHVFGITAPSRQTDATERRFRMKEVVGS